MTGNENSQGAAPESAGEESTAENPGRTFTQDELNAIVQKRVLETQRKYADYDTMKEKAGKYDAAQEAGKSELEKATSKADKYEKMYNDLVAQNKINGIRAGVSEKTGVPASLLTGATEEECQAQAEAILAFAKPADVAGGDPGYPAVRDTGETRATGKKTTADLFGDWMNQNFRI